MSASAVPQLTASRRAATAGADGAAQCNTVLQAFPPAGKHHSGALGTELVRKVTADLERNFGEQIRLSDIQDASGYSVFQIIRKFRRSLGTTPHAYLLRLRIDHAASLLADGDTIAGAAAEAGFSDQSHMTRHFKRALGMTPREYVRSAGQPERLGRTGNA